MATDKNVNFSVNATDKTRKGLTSAQRNLKKTSREAEGLAGKFRSVARATVIMEGPLGGTAGRLSAVATMLNSTNAGMIGLGVAMTATTAVMAQAIARYADFEKQTFKIEQLLKQTGGAAGITASQIEEMSVRIGRSTLESADDVRDASAALLSFKSVSGDAFGRTMEMAADMSAITGQDLKSSVIQLGKALEDPATGMTALRRSGVSFTNSQKEMIVQMREAGDVAGAQSEILAILEGQLGGAGAAAGKGLAGAIDLVAENWNLMLTRFANSGPGKVATKMLNGIGAALDKVAVSMAERGDGEDYYKRLQKDIDAQEAHIEVLRKTTGGRGKVYDEAWERLENLRGALLSAIEGDKLAAEVAKRKGQIQQEEIAKSAAAEKAFEEQKKASREAEKQFEKDKKGAAKYGERLAEEQLKYENSLLEKSHAEDIYLEERLAKIEEHRQNKLISDEEAHTQEQLAYQLHNQKITEIHATEAEKRAEEEDKRRKEQRQAIGAALTDIASLMGGHSKKLFKLGQAASIANAIMNTHEAVSKTMAKTPYPWNIPLAAAQMAAGMARVQSIRSQKFSGQREFGGPVIGGRTYLVGERGPELFTPSRTGQIINNSTTSNIGGATNSINVTVIANDAQSFEEQQKRSADNMWNLIMDRMNEEGVRFA